MTIHEKKSGKEYFDRCRRVVVGCIHDLADWTRADGKGNPESEMNAAMTTLTICLDGNYLRD